LSTFSTSPKKQSKIFIRNIQTKIFKPENFTLNTELITFLRSAILQKKNILISGATGSGKSSLLASLIQETPSEEHLIILEDTAEIPTENPRHTKMLASEKYPEKNLKSYMAYAMRMRPDRIIIGEMRAKEVTPFILAMNTGHKGLMSSLHANSAVEAISRVALLFSLYSENPDLRYEQILKLVTQNIDYVIHLDKFQIQEVICVLGSEKDHCFYEKIF
jgi:type IV secretion system protein VirB11